MKKLKVIISCVCIMMAMMMFAGCGNVSVDYDLVTCGASVTYTTVTKLKSTPINYKNKTFRISGYIPFIAITIFFILAFSPPFNILSIP